MQHMKNHGSPTAVVGGLALAASYYYLFPSSVSLSLSSSSSLFHQIVSSLFCLIFASGLISVRHILSSLPPLVLDRVFSFSFALLEKT